MKSNYDPKNLPSKKKISLLRVGKYKQWESKGSIKYKSFLST